MKKVKIVNMKKFIRSIIILLGLVIVITFISTKASLSHNKEQMNYGTVAVGEGDTLWAIATNQKQNNPYYQNKDIRFVISELKKINHLENGNLQIGQELKVPVM